MMMLLLFATAAARRTILGQAVSQLTQAPAANARTKRFCRAIRGSSLYVYSHNSLYDLPKKAYWTHSCVIYRIHTCIYAKKYLENNFTAIHSHECIHVCVFVLMCFNMSFLCRIWIDIYMHTNTFIYVWMCVCTCVYLSNARVCI